MRVWGLGRSGYLKAMVLEAYSDIFMDSVAAVGSLFCLIVMASVKNGA